MTPELRSSRKSTNVRSFREPALRGAFQGLEALSADLAARAAARLFCTPGRAARPEREEKILASAHPFSLEVRGGPIAAWSWGQGAPVFLVHGWAGRGAQLGALVAPLVGRGHRVIAFDARAHGDTAGRQADLLDFRDPLIAAAHLAGRPRAIVAHSFGAAAAWSAILGGVEAESLVLIAPVASLESGLRRFADGLGLRASTADRMIERIERRTGLPLPAVEPLEIAPRLGAIRTLIVHDRGDREVAFSQGEALARACARATLVPTEGRGHSRILRDADLAEVAARFIAGESRIDVPATEALELDRFLFRREDRAQRAV